MPEITSPSSVRLYIGFGGSGAKTLAAFAKNLVQHREWGGDVDTHFAFLLLDTDKGELKQYSDEIRATCRQIGRDPIVRVVQTSDGVANFQVHVSSKLQDARHHANLKRAWWYSGSRGDGEPFTARRLRRSPEEGAAQCPLVSTFLAWNAMDRVGEEIESILESLKRRVTILDGGQNFAFEAVMVTGLAGGTGRGCWHLLGFKIRETLHRMQIDSKPVGYFFDSSVFEEVMAGSPSKALKLRVNALTGMSELSAWMRNADAVDADRVYFELPHLDRPADSGANHITVKGLVTNEAGELLPGVPDLAPISQAFVIFGGGKAGRPGKPEFYYEIAANAMYSRLIKQVATRTINTETGMGGIGAASIEVPIVRIRNYVRHFVEGYLLESQARQESHDTIKKWTGILTDPLQNNQSFNYVAKEDGSFLQRVLHGVLSHQSRRLERIRESVFGSNKDYEVAGQECEVLDGWPGSKAGTEAIASCTYQEILETYWGVQSSPDAPGTGGLLRKLAAIDRISPDEWNQLYKPGGPDASGVNPISLALQTLLMKSSLRISHADGSSDSIDLSGFGTRQALAASIAAQLQQIARDVPGAPTSPSPGAKSSFDKARKGIFSSSIDEGEADDIESSARLVLRTASMSAVKNTLVFHLNRAADDLRVLASEFDTVREKLRSRALESRARIKTERDNLFWTDEDFELMVRQSAEDRADTRLLAEQILEPIEDDKALEDALEKMANESRNDRFLERRVRFAGELRRWVDAARPGSDRAERDRELNRLIDKGVDALRAELELPRQFYIDHFGFFATVRGLIGHWLTAFANRRANEVELERLKASFRARFGMHAARLEDRFGWKRPSEDELTELARSACKSMAYSLGNRCDVLFQAQGAQPAHIGDSVSVILPDHPEFGSRFAEDLRSESTAGGELWKKQGLFNPVSTWQDEAGGCGNPFAMFAYAQADFPEWQSDQGLDRIASLSYHTDPEVAEWLVACESDDARSYFSDSDLPRLSETIGLGYVHPEFVRNGQLAGRRWRPWIRHGRREVDARSAFALDAIAFALLDEPVGDAGKNLLRVNEQNGWDMPLLQLGAADSGRKWQFMRRSYRISLGTVSADHPAIKAGEGYTSIRKLLDALGVPAKVEAIAEEATIYLERYLPGNDDQGVSADHALREMFRISKQRLEAAREAEAGHTQEEYRKLFDRLLSRVETLAGMTCSQLLDHFRRRGQD